MPLTDDALRGHTEEQLLVLALEEAAEVVHAACKALRFGLDGHHPKDTKWEISNVHALCVEGEQLGATLRILGAKTGINYAGLVDARHKAAIKQEQER